MIEGGVGKRYTGILLSEAAVGWVFSSTAADRLN